MVLLCAWDIACLTSLLLGSILHLLSLGNTSLIAEQVTAVNNLLVLTLSVLLNRHNKQGESTVTATLCIRDRTLAFLSRDRAPQ